MSIIVQKYGGSSVSDIDKLKKIARMIADVKLQGHDIVVVVSAMGKTTNQLIEMAHMLSSNPQRRELDMLLSTGERTTMALLCIALNELGIKAVSLTGSQSGIMTNDRHNDATVIEVRPFRVQDELAKGQVVVIGGFQGVSYKRDITTLGRGGSDTSAVAMAAALNADRCEIYSDVDGVYTTDPNIIEEAKHLPELSYEQVQEMAEAGAKVLNAEAVQFAKKSKIAIYARSTFYAGKETIVREMLPVDKPAVIAVVHETEIARIIIQKNNLANELFEVFDLLKELKVSVKELNFIRHIEIDKDKLSFIVSKKNIHNWQEVESKLVSKYQSNISIDKTNCAVSLIGEGFSRDNRIVLETLRVLNENKIDIFGLTTTSFRLSFLIKEIDLNRTVEVLHNYWIE
jgi:aspartate kinase